MSKKMFPASRTSSNAVSSLIRIIGVTVNGTEREAAWRKGGGLVVRGVGLTEGDVFVLYGEPFRIVELHCVILDAELYTLILRASSEGGSGDAI